MELKVQVMNTELIKPSHETPDHLRIVKLSLLDQLAPPNYFSLTLLYESDGSNDHAKTKIQKLKQSLSETLNLFYPVAGRIEGIPFFSINCDDTGVEFTEAHVENKLSDLLRDFDPEELKKLLPEVTGDVLLTVQASVFTCGGIAIAVCQAHQIGDATSMMSFLKAWASTCRGDQDSHLPAISFGTLEHHFSVRDLSSYPFSSSIVMTDKAPVSKRLVFDKEKLMALKKLVTTAPNSIQDPTKVELVSAFLWRFFIDVAKPDEKKPYAAVHAVNIRPRTDPPHILDNVFGNCFVSPFAMIQNDMPYHELVAKLRQTIRKIDHKYLKEAQAIAHESSYGKDLINACNAITTGGIDVCVFSSWSGFPVYEVDYGWGSPVWAGSQMIGINNAARLLTTKSGDGIEALINLLPENVQRLEQQFNLLGSSKI